MHALRMIMVICVLSLGVDKGLAAGTLQTLRSMDEVGAAIGACWKAPVGSKGSFVTLSFSFRRDGMLIGPPRLAAASVPGDADARQRFLSSAITAVERCAPLHLAPALAGNIAGLVFTMRFFGSKD
jgi:hypothetical protein